MTPDERVSAVAPALTADRSIVPMNWNTSRMTSEALAPTGKHAVGLRKCASDSIASARFGLLRAERSGGR
jgi:hypothetical protein